jgi:beta-glucosidase
MRECNFETFGEDPFLAGKMGAAYVNGVQRTGIGACLKHFAANNQETERYRASSEVDERTLREIYLAQFEMIVKEARPWMVMCAYNRVNGVYASQQRHLLREILKGEWGFAGAVVSDWTANHSTVESIRGGLDLEMPGPARWFGDLLAEAVYTWQVEDTEIDEAARCILRVLHLSRKCHPTAQTAGAPDPDRVITSHRTLALSVAEESIILLKNAPRNGAEILPLERSRLRSLAVIGPGATDLTLSGGGSANSEAARPASPLAVLREILGQSIQVRYEQGCDNWVDIPLIPADWLSPFPPEQAGSQTGMHGLSVVYYASPDFSGVPFLQRIDRRLDGWWYGSGPVPESGLPFSARWSGSLQVPASGQYILRWEMAGRAHLVLDDKELLHCDILPENYDDILREQCSVQLEQERPYSFRLEFHSEPQALFSQVRLECAYFPEPDRRIEQAEALARDSEVVLLFAGTTDQFEGEGLDRPHLHLPGAQDVLIERVAAANPKTILILNTGGAVEMPWVDRVAAILQLHFPGEQGCQALIRLLFGENNPSGKLVVTYPRRFEDTPAFANLGQPGSREVRYEEGIFIGYRHYDKGHTEPLFPFGHGLSYTCFRYGPLRLPERVMLGDSLTVSLDVTNSGKQPGKEVVQLYISDPEASLERPEKELKGFQKMELVPGETRQLSFPLDPHAMSFYQPGLGWVCEPGEFHVLVGASAGDIRSRGKFTLFREEQS